MTILKGICLEEDITVINSSKLSIETKALKNEIVFSIDISDRDFDNFNAQIEDTINFLKKNYSELNELKSSIVGLKWEIDYGYESKVSNGELAVENLQLPIELLSMCSSLQISIVVSLYNKDLFKQ